MDFADLGVPVRVSNGAQLITCEECGAAETVIESLKELIVTAAVALSFVPYKLNDEEIRFCRKAIGKSGKDLALLLGVKPETVSRWENGKQPINDATEKIFRQIVVVELKDSVPHLEDIRYENIFTLILSPVRNQRDVPLLKYNQRPKKNYDVQKKTVNG